MTLVALPVPRERDEAGAHWFVDVVERGGRVVVRVIPRRDGARHGGRQAALEAFAPPGVSGEGGCPGLRQLVSLSVRLSIRNEALTDPNHLVLDPDSSSLSGRTQRIIDWRDTIGRLVTVIALPDEGTL